MTITTRSPSRGLSKRSTFYIKRLYTISHTLSSSALVFTMNALKKMMALLLSLWLILITPALARGSGILSSSKEGALVGGSGVYGSSKKEGVMARGPVPPSSSNPCSRSGVGNGNDQPCPPSTHPWWTVALWDWSLFCCEQVWWWCCYALLLCTWLCLVFFDTVMPYELRSAIPAHEKFWVWSLDRGFGIELQL